MSGVAKSGSRTFCYKQRCVSPSCYCYTDTHTHSHDHPVNVVSALLYSVTALSPSVAATDSTTHLVRQPEGSRDEA